MAAKNPSRQAREAKARLRAYRARQAVHERSVKRRTRDNIVAGVGLLIAVVLLAALQIFYITGPGAPTPAPAPSPSPSASLQPSDAPSPGAEAPTGAVPSKTIAEGRTWTGTLTLNDVALGVELDGAAAPQAVSSTISLVSSGFYDGLSCHRMTDGGFYILQCGDPNGDGSGGPGYSYGPIENAPANDVYPAGTLAMARQGLKSDSMGSQFFIVYEETKIPSDAAGGYTVIGHITSGLDQLRSKITDAGVLPDGDSTKPAVPTTITGFTLK
ncbi:peptidylprolyl isomerase [Homoserinimonas sp. OAct 916]|uniref:peptidylprolyl isomerase n=1 Tax=Homoserinimonas sp. OAct 916 TaxID=2211450 RepID=UPI000DBE720F|nr:peptidylprolyl isomerase [Homoserinimonas sp. OAct 916]